jgi:hypothetical protein
MLNDILKAASIPSQAARFPDPPAVHAIYFDSVDADGPDDGHRRIYSHDCTVELYAPTTKKGDKALQQLAAELNARGISYTTQGWYWLDAIQRYQEVIELSYTQKI